MSSREISANHGLVAFVLLAAGYCGGCSGGSPARPGTGGATGHGGGGGAINSNPSMGGAGGAGSTGKSGVCVATPAQTADNGAGTVIEWPGPASAVVIPAPDVHHTLGPIIAGGAGTRFRGIDSTGNFYFNWLTYTNQETQEGFLKLNPDATIAWQVAIDTTMIVNYGGNVNKAGETVIVGTNNLPNGGSAIYTAKYTPAGILAWSSQFQQALAAGTAAGIEPDESVVTAALVNLVSQYVIMLIKYAPDGTQLWSNKYCNEHGEAPEWLLTDSAGNIYVATRFDTFAFTADGTPLFSAPVGGNLALSHDESALYVHPVTGPTETVIKLDSKTGSVVWTAHLATALAIRDLLPTADGLYLVGETTSAQAFWARYDEQGTQQWIEQWASSAVMSGNIPGVALLFQDPKGGVVVMAEDFSTASLGTAALRVGIDGTPLPF